jgi:hypothetical protein
MGTPDSCSLRIVCFRWTVRWRWFAVGLDKPSALLKTKSLTVGILGDDLDVDAEFRTLSTTVI